MTRAAKAIAWLLERGLRVTLTGDWGVSIKGPQPLPPALLARLKPIKTELTKELLRHFIASEFPAEPHHDPAALQQRADQRNREAIANGHTDRFCACGSLAENAWRISGKEKWVCDFCNEENQ